MHSQLQARQLLLQQTTGALSRTGQVCIQGHDGHTHRCGGDDLFGWGCHILPMWSVVAVHGCRRRAYLSGIIDVRTPLHNEKLPKT